MLIYELLNESIGRTLYHGTLRKNIESILQFGLFPSLGDHTKQAYDIDEDGDMDSYANLVFAADKEGLGNCISAIGSQIRLEYPKEKYPYGASSIGRYGALCIIKEGGDYFVHRTEDEEEPPEYAQQVEPDDYYLDRRIKVDYILVGKKLIQFINKYTKRYNSGPRDMRQSIIKHRMKTQNDRPNVVSYVKSLSDLGLRQENSKISETQVSSGESPLLFYHGTSSKFTKFKNSSNIQGNTSLNGFCFTTDIQSARSYAISASRINGKKTRVLTAHLMMNKPLDITPIIARLQKKKFSFGDAKRKALEQFDPMINDSIIFRGNNQNPDEYVVFDASQISIVNS